MLDAQPNLVHRLPGLTMNAEVGRQPDVGIAVLQARRATGTVADLTVFGLGTNGPLSPAQIDAAISLTAGHRLVIVTSHCPYCAWTDANNANVHRLCTAAAHCYVADFQAEANKHREWFGSDGVHMAVGGAGGEGYAVAVMAAIAAIPS